MREDYLIGLSNRQRAENGATRRCDVAPATLLMARLFDVCDNAVAVHLHWHLFWFYAKNKVHRVGIFGGRSQYDGISDCIVVNREVNAAEISIVFFFHSIILLISMYE